MYISKCFATTGEALGRTSVIKHAVKTTGRPIRQPMHCYLKGHCPKGSQKDAR